MNKKIKYDHNAKESFDYTSPKIIAKIVYDILQPKSIVDVGCGIGNWLNEFQILGVNDYLGIDGTHLNKKLFLLDTNKLKLVDLEQNYSIDRKFDLAVSLEVAEHLSENSADLFIENLCNLSNTILFSAAIPGQGGQNHINEKPVSYWKQKFEEKQFVFFDIIRPIIWDLHEIKPWYRQNIFIASKTLINFSSQNELIDVVHPDFVEFKKREILNGELGVKTSIFSLINSLKNKLFK